MTTYVVTILQCEEAIMNGEAIVGTFKSIEKAKDFFENEKEKIFNSVGKNKECIREDTPNRFVVYSDELSYGAVINLEEINEEGVTITHF